MEPTDLEKNVLLAQRLLAELELPAPTEVPPKVPGGQPLPARAKLDRLTAELCGKLKQEPDVRQRSPEMQQWWREHQAADRLREKQEAKAREWEALVSKLKQDLTRKEIQLLKSHGLRM